MHHLVVKYLKKAARKKKTVTYSEIMNSFKLQVSDPEHRATISTILGDISRDAHAAGEPLLSILVVSSKTARPGTGFYNLARELGALTETTPEAEDAFYVKEVQRVFEHWRKPAAAESKPGEAQKKTEPEPGEDRILRPEMRKVLAGAGAEDTTSAAEVRMLEYFERLPDAYTIIHSAKWLGPRTSQFTEGEADFVVAHPRHGVLVIEVKGGQIVIEKGKWHSIDRGGRKHQIKDPAAQADRSRYALLDWLRNHQRSKDYTYPVFSAVAFPDVEVMMDIRPDIPREIVMDMTAIDNLERSLETIFAYWQNKYTARQMSGPNAIQALVDVLVPTMTLAPNILALFESERKKIEQLTEQQFSILKLLKRQRQAKIVGGAGTGKTMIAIEKANQLAEAGERVLFLCFNRGLSEWLDEKMSDVITVSTFHAMVRRVIDEAGIEADRDEFMENTAELLADGLAILHRDKPDWLFDALIVDEGQDFEDEWWIVVPDLLKDSQQDLLYVFFDDNQRIYTRISEIPPEGMQPFSLWENCRTTQEIHEVLEPYSHTEEKISCLGPEGRPVEFLPGEDEMAQRKSLKKVLHRLVHEQKVPPQDIVILTTTSERNSHLKEGDKFSTLTLTWQSDQKVEPNMVQVSNVYLFKGLESPVVIFIELDKIRNEIQDQLIYVGLSRARNHVVVIGELPAPQQALI